MIGVRQALSIHWLYIGLKCLHTRSCLKLTLIHYQAHFHR